MKKIDTTEWKEFSIGELFDIHPTKAYKLTNSDLMSTDGKNPIVVNSSFNNGIGGYTNQDNTEKGGIVTFSDTTSAEAIFYQKKDFVGYHTFRVCIQKNIKTNGLKNLCCFL